MDSEEYQIDPEPETAGAAAKWVCSVCGYIHEGDAPPEKCPLCGVPAEHFAKQEAPQNPTKWACCLCGSIYEGDAPPEQCPVCGMPAVLDLF